MIENKLAAAIDMMIVTEHTHRMLIDFAVRNIGIHQTQHRILIHLFKRDKLPSQKELADHLHVTPAAVTGALKKLENQGYITRTLGQDNRYNEISITEKGIELLETTKEAFSRVDASLFSDFSEEELDSYVSCLEKMQANMKNRLNQIHANQEKGKTVK